MDTQVDLIRVLTTIRRRWRFVLFFMVLGGVFAGIVTFKLLEPMYRATTTVYVGKDTRTMATTAYGDIMLGEQLIKDYKEIAQSRAVAENAIKILNVEGITPEKLSAMVKINVITDTRVFQISVESSDRFFAASAVDAISQAFRAEAERIMQLNNVQVIDEAKVPTAPVWPNNAANLTLGILLGFAVATALSIIFELLDNTIKSDEDIKRRLGLNVLGVIHDYNERKLTRSYVYDR